MKRKESKFLSRKLILTTSILIIGVVLIALDKISGTEFLALITANLGVYTAGNVGDKYVER